MKCRITMVGTQHYVARLQTRSSGMFEEEQAYLMIGDGGSGTILVDSMENLEELEFLIKEAKESFKKYM